ncbi:hypothetical protein ONS95_001452 [Cadophora gregata]|uniref:uncharacterized protein n=1 Tax=Cadophora gregata TaxID=51156 RepID=UPI0026DBA83C|nr:uncharacterized protein ONS95_001452 [Cadophora gregata]KAK0111072.1 hypothetical protein ONS95_001452 [Cadophora gregata]KAK0112464.1 hypothetical protein ONS96_001701 [Cadophora gregata f. sp. sojae]
MEPPIEDTVRLLNPRTWALGSLMLCKVLEDGCNLPSDTVCSWRDTGDTYYLQRRDDVKDDITTGGDPTAGRLANSKFHRANWNLGQDTFCKAKVWVEGLTTEADTIKWVNKHIPSLPTPEIIYTWTDVKLCRTITLTKRVSGKLLRDAWIDLDCSQQHHLADQIANHLKLLSVWESEYIETVLHAGFPCSCGEAWSLREREALPAVIPRLEPRVPREEYEKFVTRRNAHLGITVSPPDFGEPLILQHLQCTPQDVFVEMPTAEGEMPKVTAIFGWSHVAYFPKYKVATNPRESGYFGALAHRKFRIGDDHWRWMLSNACVRLGFPLAFEYAKAHSRVEHKDYVGIPIEYLVSHDHLVQDEDHVDIE